MFGVFLAVTLTLFPVLQQSGGTLPSPELPPPTPEQVFAIPDELREDFREQVLETAHSPALRLKRLVEFMFDKKGLGVEYQPDATNTVTETYLTRKADCLAFTLMTVALAREAGLQAYGQKIDRILAWDRVGRVIIQYMHANAGVLIDDQHFVVDVATNRIKALSVQNRIDDERLLALYYSNRAMELMVKGRYVAAGSWLNVALRYDPGNAAIWNNAGVLNQRMGNADRAESMFLAAAEKDSHLASALSNLVAFYRSRGDAARAVQWQKRADRVMRKDPFYQFSLAQQKEEAGDYPEAVRLYRRAITLNRDEDVFHFGLARTYYRMGQRQLAGLELERAYELSTEQDKLRYRGKLSALQQARH